MLAPFVPVLLSGPDCDPKTISLDDLHLAVVILTPFLLLPLFLGDYFESNLFLIPSIPRYWSMHNVFPWLRFSYCWWWASFPSKLCLSRYALGTKHSCVLCHCNLCLFWSCAYITPVSTPYLLYVLCRTMDLRICHCHMKISFYYCSVPYINYTWKCMLSGGVHWPRWYLASL